ncbi:MAG: hypothetical protein GWO11_05160 [Desulfuromonadales bacterium]|nr:hypothetical protein [Desulfuromonadales bacterium]NIR33787.1 hypothetical protein [Desulfuromonadales bacterium]NIS42471.1 hypothetical protein [Desulfuromonadales bacterium]
MKRFSIALLFCLGVIATLAAPVFAFDDVTPDDAFTLATSDDNVYILDVRTPEEWSWVGHPGKNKLDEGAELEGKVTNISYKIVYKGDKILNPSFMSDVDDAFGGIANVVLITMCRSGSRSAAAAADLEAAGYNVLNMATGFQGGKDDRGYRTVSGWVNAGLPYSYSGSAYKD